MINSIPQFLVFSGEGIYGTFEIYKGSLTQRAMKSRITKEFASGSRWAYMLRFEHVSKIGQYVYSPIYIKGNVGRDVFGLYEDKLREIGAK